MSFTSQAFDTNPLLTDTIARFFGELCYLPQATLGRLLEIYSERKTSTNSPLTQFVKELLGLDPLDALTVNVTRIRDLVPEYRRIEGLQGSTIQEAQRATQALAAARTKAETDQANCLALLADLKLQPEALDTIEHVDALTQALGASQAERSSLAALERTRAVLQAAATAWRALPVGDAERDLRCRAVCRDEAGRRERKARRGSSPT